MRLRSATCIGIDDTETVSLLNFVKLSYSYRKGKLLIKELLLATFGFFLSF